MREALLFAFAAKLEVIADGVVDAEVNASRRVWRGDRSTGMWSGYSKCSRLRMMEMALLESEDACEGNADPCGTIVEFVE